MGHRIKWFSGSRGIERSKSRRVGIGEISIGESDSLLGELIKDFVEKSRDLLAHLAVLIRTQVFEWKEGTGEKDQVSSVRGAQLFVKQKQRYQPILEHKAVKVALGEKAVLWGQFVATVGQKNQWCCWCCHNFLHGFEELVDSTQRTWSTLSSFSRSRRQKISENREACATEKDGNEGSRSFGKSIETAREHCETCFTDCAAVATPTSTAPTRILPAGWFPCCHFSLASIRLVVCDHL